MEKVYASRMTSVSALKKNPSAVVAEGEGKAVAVLSHNRVMAYVVPPARYEELLQRAGMVTAAGAEKDRS